MKRGIAWFLITFFPFEIIVVQEKSIIGIIKESIVCKGIQRNFILHLPGNTSELKLHPLVIALHGGGGDAEGMVKLTKGKFDKLADRDGFIVIYRDGLEKHWNDGRRGEETGYKSQEQDVDDIGFISELIDKMIKERKADPSRVYVTGMSKGAMMSYRCGCELSEKITAIAPVAGNIPENLLSSCKPVRPVSLLAINSTKDPLMPNVGGEVTGPFGK